MGYEAAVTMCLKSYEQYDNYDTAVSIENHHAIHITVLKSHCMSN